MPWLAEGFWVGGAEDGAGVNRGGDQGEVNSLSMPPRKQQNKL